MEQQKNSPVDFQGRFIEIGRFEDDPSHTEAVRSVIRHSRGILEISNPS